MLWAAALLQFLVVVAVPEPPVVVVPEPEELTKGFVLLPPSAAEKLKARPEPFWSCWLRSALVSSVLRASPFLYAQIHLPASLEKLWEPPLQVLQLEQRTLAVMVLPDTPEPSSSDIWASPLKSGSCSPFPSRGETVTFFPSEEVYMMKMFAPFIWVPCPSATHCILVGAVIWKKISPVPEEAVEPGMLSE